MNEGKPISEAIEDSLANLKLEGLEPSEFTKAALDKVASGEISWEEYHALGVKRFTDSPE